MEHTTHASGCKYCYANSNIKLVKKNQKLYNHDSPLLIGEVKNNDKIIESTEKSFRDTQTRLL